MADEKPPLATPEVAPTPEAPAKPPIVAPARRTLERGLLWTIALILACMFLHFARPVLVPLAGAWVLAAALKPAVRFLQRMHLPAPVGAMVVLIVLTGLAVVATVQLASEADRWVADAPAHLHRVRTRLEPLLEPMQRWSRASVEVSAIANASEPDAVAAAPSGPPPGAVFEWTRQLVVGGVSTLVLVFFLLAAGDRFRQKLLHLLPTFGEKRRALEIVREIEEHVTVFLFTVSCVNVALGLIVWLALRALGMPGAELWGVVAALVNYVPYFGPVLGVGALLLAGVAEFKNLGEALMPAAIYLGLHLVESNLVTPHVLGRRLRLNPLVVFIALLFWSWVWGVPGALLAVPLLLCLRIVAERVERLAPLVEFLDR